MTTITATSILSSKHALDSRKRIDTLLLRYPRCIHAEVMTHRMFSRNASSSRALPVEKLIQSAIDEPFIPLYWGMNQKGMQANTESQNLVDISGMLHIKHMHFTTNEAAWLVARNQAVETAKAFVKAGYHKQLVNRILEPFTHITVVVTSSNWSNFLALRDHKDAEPHIQILAQRVREALDGAEVQTLQPGEWHLPFVTDQMKKDHKQTYYNSGKGNPDVDAELMHDDFMRLSVACCASTSYKTVDGFDMTMERAIAIYDKLYTMKPIHASPFEHVVQAAFGYKIGHPDDFYINWKSRTFGGNLGDGWIQLRKTLKDECL